MYLLQQDRRFVGCEICAIESDFFCIMGEYRREPLCNVGSAKRKLRVEGLVAL
jgi:hypothetical protein